MKFTQIVALLLAASCAGSTPTAKVATGAALEVVGAFTLIGGTVATVGVGIAGASSGAPGNVIAPAAASGVVGALLGGVLILVGRNMVSTWEPRLLAPADVDGARYELRQAEAEKEEIYRGDHGKKKASAEFRPCGETVWVGGVPELSPSCSTKTSSSTKSRSVYRGKQ